MQVKVRQRYIYVTFWSMKVHWSLLNKVHKGSHRLEKVALNKLVCEDLLNLRSALEKSQIAPKVQEKQTKALNSPQGSYTPGKVMEFCQLQRVRTQENVVFVEGDHCTINQSACNNIRSKGINSWTSEGWTERNVIGAMYTQLMLYVIVALAAGVIGKGILWWSHILLYFGGLCPPLLC